MDIKTLFTGNVILEGKTKIIGQHPDDATKVVVVSKPDITAGDGAKHDVIEGKDVLANKTACNVFRLLQARRIPVAFDREHHDNSFIAPRCSMLPYEVVVRREAHGSYLKRNLDVLKGARFPDLVVEFFLKTSGRRWKEHELPCDDPLMRYFEHDSKIRLYEPSKSIAAQKPFLILHATEVFGCSDEWRLFPRMKVIAKDTFLILEEAWQKEGGKLVDFKVEFGMTLDDRLLLADVIDNDSWRVLDEHGENIDKQVYRDGGTLDDVVAKYRFVAEVTSRFL